MSDQQNTEPSSNDNTISSSRRGEILAKLKELLSKNTELANEEFISILKSIGIETNRNLIHELRYPHGENLLHWAGAYNNAAMCEYLIKTAGIHVNMENYRGTTPLYYAAMSNSFEAIKVLLANGANSRRRSGFSGLFPHEIAKKTEVRQYILEIDAKLIPNTNYGEGGVPSGNIKRKKEFNLYSSYIFRHYVQWAANLDYYIRPNQDDDEGDFIIPEARELYNHGISYLVDRCNQLLHEYLRIVQMDQSENPCLKAKLCLACSKPCTKRCGKCKEVYFCSIDCQRDANLLHKVDCGSEPV